MNLKDRLTFIKAGYTKEEINSMIDDEKQNEGKTPEGDEVPEGNDDITNFVKVVSSLAEEVKSMKKAIQKDNIDKTSMGAEDDNIDNILKSIINPYDKEEKKEDK